MASTPSARPSLRIETDSIPPSSARRMAVSRTRSLVRGARRFVAMPLTSLRRTSRLTPVAYTVCMDRKDLEGPVKAIVHHRYGSPDVLELEDIDKPAVDDDGVL